MWEPWEWPDSQTQVRKRQEVPLDPFMESSALQGSSASVRAGGRMEGG